MKNNSWLECFTAIRENMAVNLFAALFLLWCNHQIGVWAVTIVSSFILFNTVASIVYKIEIGYYKFLLAGFAATWYLHLFGVI
jgi:hypothetical protein